MNLPGFIITTRFGGPSYGFNGTITVYPDRPAAESICRHRNATTMRDQAGPFTVRPVELRDLPAAGQQENCP